MIIESIVSSLALDTLLRKWRTRRVKNNLPAIREMQRGDSPVVLTVGELREVLSIFADDTPIIGGSFEYANVQLINWLEQGTLCVGSQNYLPEVRSHEHRR